MILQVPFRPEGFKAEGLDPDLLALHHFSLELNVVALSALRRVL